MSSLILLRQPQQGTFVSLGLQRADCDASLSLSLTSQSGYSFCLLDSLSLCAQPRDFQAFLVSDFKAIDLLLCAFLTAPGKFPNTIIIIIFLLLLLFNWQDFKFLLLFLL